MDALALQSIAESSGQIAQVARTFGVDWPHLVAQIVSFGIVCAVLYGFAYKPILQMLAARREQIASGLANAVGRNPGASTKIMVQSILAIAFAEAVVFYALFLVR